MTILEPIILLQQHKINCEQDTVEGQGIDDKTKIDRLRLLVQRLEEENEKLRREKTLLEFELGITPFNYIYQ